jgi:glycosyltransferase involved in cell wall biosynthesis
MSVHAQACDRHAVRNHAGSGQLLTVQFFTSYSHPQGTYFRYHNLAVGLTRLGHQVTVYAGDWNSESRSRSEMREGVRYCLTPESRLARFFGMASDPLTVGRRFARVYPKCDIAHLFQPFPSAAAAWFRSRANLRFYDWDDLWTGGLLPDRIGHWRHQWPARMVRLLEPRLPRRAHHVTTVSGFLADRALQFGATGVSVIHNGFWPAAFPEQPTARSRLGLRQDALYAGFMGRTTAELPWCFDAVAANLNRVPRLRLALCGVQPSALHGLAGPLRERIDYLGQLSPAATRDFAAAIDLGLLPLEDNPFNRSRFPIKFADHLASGRPLLCSTVGECGRLVSQFPWAVAAGAGQADWLDAFREAIDSLVAGQTPAVDPDRFNRQMSWHGLSQQLEQAYRSAMAAK